MHDAVIVSAVRTAVGKAPKGALSTVRPDEMAATVIAETLRRAPGVEPREIDDVILGCAMPEAEQGLNVARIASLRAGVPVEASAVTINRFCSSGSRPSPLRPSASCAAGRAPSWPAAPSP
jgi:acetyl-CoA acyltransferase